MTDWITSEQINFDILPSKYKDCITFINEYIDNSSGCAVSNVASGIGDILIFKNNNPSDNIFYNIKHLLDYKPFPDNLINIKFNIELMLKLFGKNQLHIFYAKKVMMQLRPLYKIDQSNIIKNFTISKIFDYKYIIIHTKVRFGFTSETIVSNAKLALRKLFSNVKSKYKILILGERKLDENSATKAIPAMTTIYNECMLLKNNNNIIDLTEEKMYNTPDMVKFERDIALINNAEFNIGVGHGGQFCFNLFFSKKSIYYCPPNLINFNIHNPNIRIVTDITEFTKLCMQNI
jgi:hypothetical protein